MAKSLLVVLLVLVTAACVSVNKSIITPNPTGVVFAKDSVQVFSSTDSIPSYTQVAILDAKDVDDWMTNMEDVIDELRKEAGKLGANAIILQEMHDPSTLESAALAYFWFGAHHTGRAIAIYVPSLDKRQ